MTRNTQNILQSFFEDVDKISLRRRSQLITILPEIKVLNEAAYGLGTVGLDDMRTELKPELKSKLLSLSSRFAELSVQKSSVDYLKFGVVLLVIEGYEKDFRDTLRQLILLDDASRILQVDFNILLEEAFPISNPKIIAYLQEWIDRPSELKQLNQFDVERAEANGLFVYKSIPKSFV